jgi:hypothetical protein
VDELLTLLSAAVIENVGRNFNFDANKSVLDASRRIFLDLTEG